MPSDSNVAIQFFSLMLKAFRELRDTIKDTIDIVKTVSIATKEILNNRKETKLQEEADKGGEVTMDKLQKHHKGITSEIIQPENLNTFKNFAREFNLQYSITKEDDGRSKISYGTNHQDRFNTVVDSLARSINYKQQKDTKTLTSLDDAIKEATINSNKHNEALKENKLEMGINHKTVEMER